MPPLALPPNLLILAVLLSSLVFVTACSAPQDSAVANTKLSGSQLAPASDIEFDAELGESPWPEEGATTLAITESIQQTIKSRYANDLPALRHVHSKAHGCVLADFQVNKTLQNEHQQGIFQPGASYKAWIRFSNGDSDATREDKEGDGRGMAIKLMGVSGEKLLPDESHTQDFVMINHPVFFINDPQKYLSLIESLSSSNMLARLSAPFALGIEGSIIAAKINGKKIRNPLYTRYWSMVPYQLGAGSNRSAMKYSAKPCNQLDNTPQSDQLQDPNYLRTAMKNHLDTDNACFDFLIQTRDTRTAAGSALSVEMATNEWEESAAPFFKVATITIPKQDFDKPEQHKFCENLSYTPWHSVFEHRPLGGVNRIRKVVYTSTANLRRSMNAVTPAEPAGNEVF
ncbi:MAG: catalase family protein [Nitrosomonas sp.]|uniref:catalase family protein n=1 Tax=Nitrosomonas sp. TaxID=42353 RepID=UPI0027349FF9|nr:catalase family protein [Nitrosomonas sp.]MDP3282338.1 catalase family protein [Nitrosomonas sp.]MDP3662985.1 catalase family protein [Nitrosomonas sp.]MDZ4106962.1 catalase family protein [Nitrosomonas sp.]